MLIHGIVNNRMLKTWYNGGLATTLLGHFPIMILYIRYITEHQLVIVWDYVIGTVLMVLWYVVGVRIVISKSCENLNSSYPFAKEEMDKFERFYGKERML